MTVLEPYKQSLHSITGWSTRIEINFLLIFPHRLAFHFPPRKTQSCEENIKRGSEWQVERK